MLEVNKTILQKNHVSQENTEIHMHNIDIYLRYFKKYKLKKKYK